MNIGLLFATEEEVPESVKIAPKNFNLIISGIGQKILIVVYSNILII